MSELSSQKASVIAAIKQLEQTLKEVRKLADQAVECYQQEKNKLIMMRSNADDEIREIKLQGENTLNQLRQHIAKTNREHRREVEYFRRQWLGIEEPAKQTLTNAEEDTHFEQSPAAASNLDSQTHAVNTPESENPQHNNQESTR